MKKRRRGGHVLESHGNSKRTSNIPWRQRMGMRHPTATTLNGQATSRDGGNGIGDSRVMQNG